VQDNPSLACYINASLPIPKVFVGDGEIKLIVLGQDPTVKNPESRKTITTVLNLDKGGSLRKYLGDVCSELEIDLDHNVYVTNLLKNFFIVPPTQISPIDVFEVFGDIWLPFLREELSVFPNIPVLTLGEPLLSVLVVEGVNAQVRYYWEYRRDWQTNPPASFRCIAPAENRLGRKLFPFPHQPSLRKKFYAQNLASYIQYMRQELES
jgi:uracil-DNA glycosylase